MKKGYAVSMNVALRQLDREDHLPELEKLLLTVKYATIHQTSYYISANADGSEKRKLLVIGKSKNPRCFKNVKNLPVRGNVTLVTNFLIYIFENNKSVCTK
jgi:hypothetical protein